MVQRWDKGEAYGSALGQEGSLWFSAGMGGSLWFSAETRRKPAVQRRDRRKPAVQRRDKREARGSALGQEAGRDSAPGRRESLRFSSPGWGEACGSAQGQGGSLRFSSGTRGKLAVQRWDRRKEALCLFALSLLAGLRQAEDSLSLRAVFELGLLRAPRKNGREGARQQGRPAFIGEGQKKALRGGGPGPALRSASRSKEPETEPASGNASRGSASRSKELEAGSASGNAPFSSPPLCLSLTGSVRS